MSYYNKDELIELENKVTALTEINHLQSEENKQLAEDKAELVGALKTAISWLAVDGQWEGSPLQFQFNKLLEKHKCD